MGVQGLWELLAPVGRRVSVETLAGKKLAIGNNYSLPILTLILLHSHCKFELHAFLHRCQHMDGAVHEGDEGREGRDGSKRSFAWLFPPNLQTIVSAHQARLRFRWRNTGSQAPDRDCSPEAAWECPGQGPQDCREIAAQSCEFLGDSSLVLIFINNQKVWDATWNA